MESKVFFQIYVLILFISGVAYGAMQEDPCNRYATTSPINIPWGGKVNFGVAPANGQIEMTHSPLEQKRARGNEDLYSECDSSDELHSYKEDGLSTSKKSSFGVSPSLSDGLSVLVETENIYGINPIIFCGLIDGFCQKFQSFVAQADEMSDFIGRIKRHECDEFDQVSEIPAAFFRIARSFCETSDLLDADKRTGNLVPKEKDIAYKKIDTLAWQFCELLSSKDDGVRTCMCTATINYFNGLVRNLPSNMPSHLINKKQLFIGVVGKEFNNLAKTFSTSLAFNVLSKKLLDWAFALPENKLV